MIISLKLNIYHKSCRCRTHEYGLVWDESCKGME